MMSEPPAMVQVQVPQSTERGITLIPQVSVSLGPETERNLQESLDTHTTTIVITVALYSPVQ